MQALPRPWTVTILSAFVLFLSAWNILRAWSGFQHWEILSTYGASPAYIIVTGSFWALCGGFFFALAWQGWRFTIRAGLAFSGLYFAWYWIDRLFVQANPLPNWPFSLAVSLFLLMTFALNLISPDARQFFNQKR
jgi:hypothetical protein